MIDETSLLQMMTTIATQAGERLLAVYSPDARPANPASTRATRGGTDSPGEPR